MEPITPRKAASKPPSLTPSFTFGLSHSPSFRFTPPRNLNLLTSLSPSRFFMKASKGANDLDNLPTGKGLLPPPLIQSEEALAALGVPHEPLVRETPTSDSIGSETPMDMWSFNETRSATANMTSIDEGPGDADVFYSPSKFLMVPGSSPAPSYARATAQKRSFPGEEFASPCKRAAAKIEELTSPGGVAGTLEDDVDSKKVWTLSLDNVLLKCQKDYREFRKGQKGDSSILKYTTQNKILSKMLLNKTGVFRSAKQISARLNRLQRQCVISEEISSAQNTTHNTEDSPVSSERQSRALSGAVESTADLSQFKISFDYKDKNHAPHVFTTYANESLTSSTKHPIEDLDKILPQKGTKLASHLKSLAPKLAKQETDLQFITCRINIDLESTSSPSSPMSSSKLIAADNGRFSSFCKISIQLENSQESIISLCSSITIYKDGEQILSQTTESVNGYRKTANKYEVHAPFSRNFWAGYLTFLINGSSDFDDISHISIVQCIHDAESQNIFANMVFRFDPESVQETIVQSFRLIAPADETDELETIMAFSPQAKASSPCKSDAPRNNLRINTQFGDTFIPEAPNTAPIYNSQIMQKYNFNYANRNHAGRSMSAIYTHQDPASTYFPYGPPVMMQTPTNFSAGQMWNGNPHVQPAPPNFLDVSPQAASTPAPHNFPTPQFVVNEQHHIGLPPNLPMHPLTHQNPQHVSPQNVPFEPQHERLFEPTNRTSAGAPAPQTSWTSTPKTDEKHSKGNIKFESIMQYDPSRGAKPGQKKASASPSFHSFRSSRRFIVKGQKN